MLDSDVNISFYVDIIHTCEQNNFNIWTNGNDFLFFF